MDDREKIVEKIEKLLRLSNSNNENEAKAAMLKAQELMAKYNIEKADVDEEDDERTVCCYTSPAFRDDWVIDLAGVISSNFRCRTVITNAPKSRGVFRIRFFGYDDDAQICINIFNYAVEVIRKRMTTLRAIYAEAGRDFGRNEKMNYVLGFNSGLKDNFEEQKKQSESFALALLVPEQVNVFVDNIPGIGSYQSRDFELNKENRLLRRYGYSDGKNFRNAGNKERIEV